MKYAVVTKFGVEIVEAEDMYDAVMQLPWGEGYDVTYAIDVGSLKDLIALVKTCGNEIIVGAEDDGTLTLEIYDDYRE